MKQASFRILRFPKLNRFVAMAWNYEQAVLLATADYDTHAEASAKLEKLAQSINVELKWYDGQYDVGSDGQLIPRLFENIIA